MLENYNINNDGLIYQVVKENFTYDEIYVKERYDTYGELNNYMSNLRLGYIFGSINEPINSILDVGYGNGSFLKTCKKMYTHFYDERWDKDRYDVRFAEMLPNDGYEPFDIDKSLLHNLNLSYYSSSSIYYPNGFSVLSDLCGINYDLVNGSVNQSVYYLNHL